MPSERIAILQRFTAALSSAVTMSDVARVLARDGLDRFGARAIGIVWMMRPRSFELVFGHGVSGEEFRLLDEAARRGERLPIRDAILGRRPVWLDSLEEMRARYPVLAPLAAARGESGCAVVPLVVRDWCHGLIGMTFAQPRTPSEEERSFIEALAQLSAHAFERARLFEAEQEARCEAERVGHLQERLMAVVGHDLRTPLTAIQLAAEVLARRADLPPEVSAAVRRIQGSATRLGAIVRDLLDVGGARRGGGMSIVREPVDVAEVASRAIAEFHEREGGALVTLGSSGDTTLDADPARLAQVVSNLVGNALQHGAGSPVRVEVAGDAEAVRIAVLDAGPGIDPAVLPHVFEPFWRGEPARPLAAGDAGAEHGGRLGLGLYIVREIARAHGGEVDVASSAGSGTAFSVRIPRAAASGRSPR